MTVTTTSNKDFGTGNGVLTTFPFTFAALNSTDVLVYVAGVQLTYGSQYSVAINSSGVGGTITCAVAPANATQVLIYRQVPLTQNTSLPVEDAFDEKEITNTFDKIVMMCQQLSEIAQRSITLPITTVLGGLIFPDAAADLFLRWNSAGTALINSAGVPGPKGDPGSMNGPATSVIGNIPVFANLTGGLLSDSGSSIASVVTSAEAPADPALNGFRLSLHATNPTPGDVTGALTVYSIPYDGNKISLWDSALSKMRAVTSGIISETIAAATHYFRIGYIYEYLNAGVADLEIDWWDSAGQSTKAITLLTIANPCVITCTSHGWNVGDKIGIRRGTASGTAWTDTAMGLDQKEFYISAKTTNTLTLEGCDTSALAVTNYTGATAYKIPATPTTSPARTEGVWFKTGDRTRRLVGGFMTNGAGTIDDTSYARMLSNVDNLVLKSVVSEEPTASYTSPALSAYIPRTGSLALGVTRTKLFNCLPINAIITLSDSAEGGTTGSAAIGINRCPNGLTKTTWKTALTAVVHVGYYNYSSCIQVPVALVAGFTFIQHHNWADGTPYAGSNNITVSSRAAIATNYLG